MRSSGIALVLAVGLTACAGGPAGDDIAPPSDAGVPSEPGAPSEPSADCPAGAPVPGRPALRAATVVSGLDRPVSLQAPPGDPRLFVVEQRGRIRVVRDGTLLPAPFVDLAGEVGRAQEGGLLGLAFHPDYAENGRFFLNYTTADDANTRIVEMRVSGSDPDRADRASERLLLGVRQPFNNHNGGSLAFGPDGYLYAGLGDGGAAGDPLGNAQRLDTPLGKILRLDVDGPEPFGVPADNPFVQDPAAFPAIWAYGLRNPWRIAFDAASGDLYIGDVGQNRVEEIDVGLAGRAGGENYGWPVREGSLCYSPSRNCPSEGLVPPVAEYDHAGESCAVVAGAVYRGCRLPGWSGTFFYADFCAGFIRSFRLEGGAAVDAVDWTSALNPNRAFRGIASFGTDAGGEVYFVSIDTGRLYRIEPAG